MISFRAKARFVGAALAVFAASAAVAADSEAGGAGAAPVQSTEVSSGISSSGLTSIGARPGVNEGTVEMGTLGAPDTAAMGLSSDGGADMPTAMWAGTSRETATRLLAEAPRPTTSRALQTLGRKVLLSRADPPQGSASGPTFLTLRLRRLLELGDLDSVLQLSQGVLVNAQTSGEQMVRADALLFRGDDSEACTLANTMRRFNADIYWVKLAAFCAVRGGNTGAAELAVNLMHEQGIEDATFYTLYDRLAIPADAKSPPPPVTLARDASALTYAMSRAAGLGALNPDTFAGRPVLLRVIALNTGSSAGARLSASVTAAKLGAVPVASLRALFALQGFSEAELGYPESAANTVEAARAPALFYQSVQMAYAPEPRLTRAAGAYRYARPRGLAPVMGELLVPSLEPIVAAPDFVNSAADMVELYLAAGATTLAYDWFGIIEPRKAPGLEPARYDHLSTLLRIAQQNDKLTWTPKDVDRLVDRAEKQGGEALAERSFEINLLAALGSVVDPKIWERLPAPTPVSDGALQQKVGAFEQAAAGGRIAESALLALEVLSANGPAGAPKGAVVTVVRGLKTLGLDSDARAVALEAAMGAPAKGS